MSVKLTKAQRELLGILPSSVSEHYRPALKLVELGLAAWEHRAFGDTLVATDAGRAALSPTPGGEGSGHG